MQLMLRIRRAGRWTGGLPCFMMQRGRAALLSLQEGRHPAQKRHTCLTCMSSSRQSRDERPVFYARHTGMPVARHARASKRASKRASMPLKHSRNHRLGQIQSQLENSHPLQSPPSLSLLSRDQPQLSRARVLRPYNVFTAFTRAWMTDCPYNFINMLMCACSRTSRDYNRAVTHIIPYFIAEGRVWARTCHHSIHSSHPCLALPARRLQCDTLITLMTRARAVNAYHKKIPCLAFSSFVLKSLI